MKKENTIETYLTYSSKIGDWKALYKAVSEKYQINSALYPGSHIDIAPSFVIPKVTYVDNFKGAIRFFKQMDDIQHYINQQKEYAQSSEVTFIGQDYTEKIAVPLVDLIISQYAGFVGQATKAYLKPGGILLCNDSHADATLAKFDHDFELIGVIKTGNQITTAHLEDYFILSRKRTVDLEKIKATMKGPKYQQNAENYIFRKRK